MRSGGILFFARGGGNTGLSVRIARSSAVFFIGFAFSFFRISYRRNAVKIKCAAKKYKFHMRAAHEHKIIHIYYSINGGLSTRAFVADSNKLTQSSLGMYF